MVLTKYNLLKEMAMDVTSEQEDQEEALREWGNEILLVMDRDDIDSVFDEDKPGISINITGDINVRPNNMNITYQQIIENPERNPVFTFNNTRISMYPNISAMTIEFGPVKISIDIQEEYGDVLFRTLIRMMNDAKTKKVGRELMGTKELVNSGKLNRNASSLVGSFLSGVNKKSLKNQINMQKEKLARKSRKARKN
jgi:hypothetical protein